MFARYFIELPVPAERVEERLLHDPESWLPGLAREANRRGDALLAEVGFGRTHRVARTVEIRCGTPIRAGSKFAMPLRWSASGMTGLFPELEADLEVAPLGEGRTQLAMNARYAPPLGPVGTAIDRAVLFRVAEATIKDFLDRVGEALLSRAESR